MSKYIKLEDAIHNINIEVIGRKEYTGDMKANLFFALDDLPTIEVSEDNAKAVDGIIAKPSDWNDLLEPKVSEDCISRADLIKQMIDYQNSDTVNTYKAIGAAYCVELAENAPSVVPSREEGEWIDDPKNNEIKFCSNCELGYTKDFLLGMLPYDNPIPQMVEPPYCPNCGAKMKRSEL